MEWKVWYYNINQKEIVQYDIFAHSSFNKYFKKAFKKCKTKEEFADALRGELRYYYWSKAEWEIILERDEEGNISLVPWCGCSDPEQARLHVTNDDVFDWAGFAELHINRQIYHNCAKIDIFDQIDYVWDEFVNYCWSFKKGKRP